MTVFIKQESREVRVRNAEWVWGSSSPSRRGCEVLPAGRGAVLQDAGGYRGAGEDDPGRDRPLCESAPHAPSSLALIDVMFGHKPSNHNPIQVTDAKKDQTIVIENTVTSQGDLRSSFKLVFIFLNCNL